jgi:hypothetical protein
MYVAMGMGAALCFIIGIQPGLLYSLLPFEADYVPYTPWHVLQISILLGFTGLGFALMVPRLTRRPSKIWTSSSSTSGSAGFS